MKELDAVLDKHPTAAAVAEMANTRIRNIQCFNELASYNTNGRWLHVHPLIVAHSEYNQILALLRTDPAEFLHQHKLIDDNIRRYRSYLRRADRKDSRTADRDSLKKYESRAALFRQALASKNAAPHE